MQDNFLKNFTSDHLKRAAGLKAQIESLEKQLAGILHIPEALTVGGTIQRHRKMSASARAKISAAAKARWAKIKAGKK